MIQRQDTIIGELPNDWEVGLFSEDLKIQGRIGWKGYTKSDLVESGPIVIGGTEIKSSIHLRLENVKHLSRNKYDESPEIMLKHGDVLLVTRGNLGEVGYYHESYGEGTINPSVIILKEFIGDSKFLFYYLISRGGNHQVLSLTSGSSIPAIYQSEVYQLYYPRPSLIEQKAIAQVLTAFDDKIENLRAQNQTLETLAQTIFAAWFGKYQISEVIPEGWHTKKLGTFISSSIGGDYGKEEIVGEFNQETICLRGTDLPDMKMGMPEKAPIRFLKSSKLEKCRLENGDIVIEVSGGTENQSTGRVMYINSEILNNAHLPMTCVNFCRILRPSKTEYSYFIYSLFDYLYNRGVMFNWENGTTGIKNLDLKALLKSFELIIPKSVDTIIEFDKIVKSSFVKIQSNNKQIQSLAKTRDTLLPKLMSGELRVEGFKK